MAVLSLALGIGSITTFFSLIDAVMLKALPVSHPEQLLQVNLGSGVAFSNAVWEQLRDRQDVFSGIFAYGRWALNLAAGGEVRPVNGYFVSGQFFETLGVRAALGRTLTRADDQRGCAGAVVLSEGFWQREYSGRRDVVGRTISLDGHSLRIVGVVTPGFSGVDVGSWVDVMVPLCAEALIHGEEQHLTPNIVPGWLWVVGRRKPRIPASQVTARLRTLAPSIYQAAGLPVNWRAEERGRYFHETFDTEPASNGLSYTRREYGRALFILLAIAGAILLIVCANVANLLLARGAAQQREVAIRMALGSGRGHILQQRLLESLLLSSAGTALGVLWAQWGTRLLVRFLDLRLDLTPDVRVLAFAVGVTLLTAWISGIAPAWRGTQVLPQSALQSNARSIIGGGAFRTGKLLVIAQVALSLVLVTCGGLLVATFWKVTSLDPGFTRDAVLLANLDLRPAGIAPEQRPAVYREMLEKLRALPGVRSASLSNVTPICHCQFLNDVEADANAPRLRNVFFAQVSEGYFQTLGIARLAGRDFRAEDTAAAPKVALINEDLARKLFGTASPLGRQLRAVRINRPGDSYTIVGVVQDTKNGSLREDFGPTVFTLWSQNAASNPQLIFELRPAAGAPTSLMAAVRSAIGQINAGVSFEFTTLAAKVNDSIAREKLLAVLSAIFGALALLLAGLGLYGVMAYHLSLRRKEIGIRIALGADPRRVLRMMLRNAAELIAIGLAVGVGLTLAATRLLSGFLYGLSADDAPILVLAASLLAVIGCAAGYNPARRAAKLDPMTTLREE